MATLSGKGQGKGQNARTLNAYRAKRTRQRKAARAARRRNR